MKRIILFLNGARSGGKLVAASNNISDLLKCATRLFLIEAQHLYTCQGTILNDVQTLIDNQVLYVSEGEPFLQLQVETQNSVARPESKLGLVANASSKQLMRLNVGGMYFTVTKIVLLKEPDSLLAKMFSDNQIISLSKLDEAGAYLIDRNPAHFSVVLEYLKDDKINMSSIVNRDAILNEAAFFGIDSLVKELKKSQLQLQAISIEELTEFLQMLDKERRDRTSLTGTDFEGLKLSNLNLIDINFEGSSFRRCEMTCVIAKNCNFNGCNFTEADLGSSQFSQSLIEKANFTKANLNKSSISYSIFDKSLFDDTNLGFTQINRCSFNETTMIGINWIGAKVSCSDFIRGYLTDANLQSMKLESCDLRWANLTRSKFSTNSLDGSDFSHACLKGAVLDGNLKNCKLQGAVLKGANMSRCNLRQCVWSCFDAKSYQRPYRCQNNNCIMLCTDLAGSDLSGSDLTGSFLIGANLAGANVTDVLIEQDKKSLLEQATQSFLD